MKSCSTHQLNIVMSLPKCSLSCLTNYGKSLRHQIIERLTSCQAIFKALSLLTKLGVAQGADAGLMAINHDNNLAEFAKNAAFTCTQNPVKKRWHRCNLSKLH
jgi:hypothetical protein